MDFLEGLLPILLFLGVGLLKSKKKSDNETNRNNTNNRNNQHRETKESFSLKKYFDEAKDVITKQIEEITSDPNKDKVEEKKYTEDNSIKEDEIKNTVYTFEEPTKEIPKEAIKKPITDPITKGEIGKEIGLSFNRANLVNSIIMAEILGKPKALRK